VLSFVFCDFVFCCEGFAHARDRLVQMMMMRIAGRGRLSELLQSNEETQTIDVFLRKLGFQRDALYAASNLSPRVRELVYTGFVFVNTLFVCCFVFVHSIVLFVFLYFWSNISPTKHARYLLLL